MHDILIADSGSTKTEWCLLRAGKKTKISTGGLSPYFMNTEEISTVINEKILPKLKGKIPEEVHFYGTGCSNPENIVLVKKALKQNFGNAKITVDHDLMAAARALCGREKGIACILGTGSNSCYFNGKKIMQNNPGLGFILGDEGGGTQLGKKVLQHFLYHTFDEDLMERFQEQYNTNSAEILNAVYKQSLPNRYLAGFAMFLADNRGHYMVENILEDCFHEFFYYHLYKYTQSWKEPIHFTGSVAYHFKDVLSSVCEAHQFTMGNVLKSPMDGLIKYHTVH